MEFQRQEDGLDIDELSKPPGFESPIDLVDPIRETHPQNKSGKMGIKIKVVSAKTQAPRRCKQMSQASSQTSAANFQIAKEALEIRELLGIKVTSNKKAAARRITNTLKKARKTPLQSQLDKKPSK